MQIAMALYRNFTVLDVTGPFQTLVDVPGHDVVFVAGEAGPVIDHTGRCPLLASATFSAHWARAEELETLGARYLLERVVERWKVITAAGVSSGIDMALTLLGRMYGPEVAQGIQLTIEYDPQPPFDAGSPTKAPAEVVEYVRSRLTIPAMTAV